MGFASCGQMWSGPRAPLGGGGGQFACAFVLSSALTSSNNWGGFCKWSANSLPLNVASKFTTFFNILIPTILMAVWMMSLLMTVRSRKAKTMQETVLLRPHQHSTGRGSYWFLHSPAPWAPWPQKHPTQPLMNLKAPQLHQTAIQSQKVMCESSFSSYQLPNYSLHSAEDSSRSWTKWQPPHILKGAGEHCFTIDVHKCWGVVL